MSETESRRPDLSLALVHLTRERVEPDRQVGPFDVLKEILATGIIKGSGNAGFVKGSQRAVCPTETPLSALHHFATPPGKRLKRYRFNGIAISKKAAFEVGGRPVIYLPDAEAEWIPEDQRWRHVRFEHGKVDWTHEREWRVPGDLDLSVVPGYYVIVWSPNDMEKIQALDHPTKKLVRGVLSMEHLHKFL